MTDARPVEIEALLAESAWVRGLAESLVHDPAAAEDIVQETWLAALKRPPDGDRPLRPWLRRVVENFARMRGRGEGARAQREHDAAQREGPPSAHDLYERVETQRMLAKVVLEIEEPFRSTLVLRYYEGLSSAEIARRNGDPEGTVRWRLKRALELLRERLDRRHGGDRRSWYVLLLPLCREAKVVGASWLAFLTLLFVTIGIGVAFAARAWMQPASRHDAAVALAPADATPPRELETRRDALAPASVAEAPAAGEALAPGVRARLVDATGTAIAGATLEVARARDVQRAAAQSDGSVRIASANVASGEELVNFTARAAGFVPARVRALVSPERDVFLGPIELARAGTLEGTVVDARGRPLAGARVRAEIVGSRWQGFASPPLEEARYLGSMLGDDVPSATSDASGQFRIGELPESYVRLWAGCDGFETAWAQEMAVLGGEAVQAEAIVLRELDPRDCIEGVVLAPDGTPLPGARVECGRIAIQTQFFCGGEQLFRAVAGERGRFRLCVDPHSRFDLCAIDLDERFRPVVLSPVAPGERELVVRLADWRPLAIVAQAPSGEPAGELELEFLDARNERVLERATSQWRAGLQRAPYTSFFVRACSPRWGETRAGPFAAATSPETVELDFAPAAFVRGRVVREGRGVSGARVELVAALEAGRAMLSTREDSSAAFAMLVSRPLRSIRASTDAEGLFAIAADEGSRWWARVEAGDGAAALADTLRAGAGEVEIALEPAGALEGLVLRNDERPVEGSLVGLSRGDGYFTTRRVGPDGRYRFERLAPGAWQVRLVREEALGWQPLVFAPGIGTENAPRWDAQVRAGVATRFDLVVEPSRRIVLAGHLTFDGASVGPWTVELAREPRAKARAIVDPRGAFELELATGGDWSLHAFSSVRGGASYDFVDQLRVEGERSDYGREWQAASLEVRSTPGGELEAKVTWSDGSRARLEIAQLLGADGSASFPRVPAGDLRVSLGEGAPVEIRLAPGERRVLAMAR